jgi:hypothetical protein
MRVLEPLFNDTCRSHYCNYSVVILDYFSTVTVYGMVSSKAAFLNLFTLEEPLK